MSGYHYPIYLTMKNSLCRKNIYFLKYIHSLPLKRKKKFIKYLASSSEIKSILEIFLNFLNKNISCSKNFIKSMKKYSNEFVKLTDRKNSLKAKKVILSSKSGGFILQALLGLSLPILSKLFLK